MRNRPSRRRFPKRSLGQHFLVSEAIAKRIGDVCREEAGRASAVLEVGPGSGALTGELLKTGLPVHAVELDDALAESLQERFPSVAVARGDARKVDLEGMARDTSLTPWLVAGNLPYNVGTPILKGLLGRPRFVAACVVMLQREVAHKFCNGAGLPGYGALAAWTAAWWRGALLFHVPPGAFHPAPQVTSSVCLFTPLSLPLLPVEAQGAFDRFLRGAFHRPRSTLVSNLAAGPEEKEKKRALLAEMGMDPSVRPARVSPGILARIYRRLEG